MPITPAEQSRAVADKLSINGWKDDWHDGPYNEAHRCLTCHRWNIPTHAHFSQPPPDLASPAGADALMTALLKAGYKLDQWQAPAGVHFSILREGKLPPTLDEALLPENREQFEFAVDPDWKRAQLAAAYKLLCEGK